MPRLPKHLILATLLALQACGTTTSIQLDLPPGTTLIVVQDARPDSDRESGTRVVGQAEETTLGDDAITPRPVEIVKRWLSRTLGSTLAGKVVVLKRFKVDVSDPGGKVDEARFASTAGSVQGINPVSAGLARLLVGGIESARASKLVTVHVRIQIGDMDFEDSTYAAHKGRVTESNITDAVSKTMDVISKKISAQ